MDTHPLVLPTPLEILPPEDITPQPPPPPEGDTGMRTTVEIPRGWALDVEATAADTGIRHLTIPRKSE